MAIRSVATTDTLETFRTTFNSLGTDVGRFSSLSGVTASIFYCSINEFQVNNMADLQFLIVVLLLHNKLDVMNKL